MLVSEFFFRILNYATKQALDCENFWPKRKKADSGRHGKSVRDQDFGWRLVRELTRSLGEEGKSMMGGPAARMSRE